MDDTFKLLAGLTIGDGCISVNYERAKYTVTFNHSASQQDYLEWKKDILCNSLTGSVTSYYNPHTNVYYVFYRNAEVVKEAFAHFYPLGKKEVYNYLPYMEDSLNLALWFMDDGSVQRRKKTRKDGTRYWLKPSMYLSTHSFSYEENCLIKGWFESKLGISPSVQKDKSYFRLHFNAEESLKVWKIISEYVRKVPSMRDKFDLYIHFYDKKESNTTDTDNESVPYTKLD